ncbi:MAG TPA: LpqB family beta-propeller domain-containing protein [bacterium]|nr:LpqB family beta-propeller domain-containing protein [bacterium]
MRPGRASIRAAALAISLATGACGGGDGGTGPDSGVEPLRDRIVFASDRGGAELRFFVINPDGAGLAQLTNGPDRRAFGSVSPDGRRIVCNGSGSGLQGLFVMNVDGTDEAHILDHGADPVWSPDGSRIAFSSFYTGHHDVWIMDSDGSNLVNLSAVAGSQLSDDRHPTWSPDGQRIAYASDRSGQGQIWVMNADGSDPNPFTSGADPAFRPSWSPDGSLIAYSVGSDGSWSDIHGKDVSGGPGTWATTPAQNLTNHPTAQNFYVNWSPDGSRIAFTTDRTGDFETFLMNADGTNQLNLTNAPSSHELLGPGQSWAR